MLNELKKIPNQITLVRLLLIPFLYYLAYNNNRTIFVLLIILVFITDALDGFLARKLNQESEFGLMFDSFADKVVYFSLIPWFYFLEKQFFLEKINISIILISLLVILQIINLLKYKRLVFRHTILAKITAVALFTAIIIGFLTKFNDYLFYSVYLLVILNTFEEIILSIKYKDPNIKSLLK